MHLSRKLTLAKAFLEWYAETNGCPGGAYFSSFKDKQDLRQVLQTVVSYSYGPIRQSDNPRKSFIERLSEECCLLVLDDLQAVAVHDGANGFVLPAEWRTQLSEFLCHLKNGKSRGLIIDRRPQEPLLAENATRIVVENLDIVSQLYLVVHTLLSCGMLADFLNNNPRAIRLVRMINGHPGSTIAFCSLLRSRSLEEIAVDLCRRPDRLLNPDQISRLSAAVECLPPQSRESLALAGLFCPKIIPKMLSGIVVGINRFYHDTFGFPSELSEENAWDEVLSQAHGIGLVAEIGYSIEVPSEPYGIGPIAGISHSMYEIPFSVSVFLHAQLLGRIGEDRPGQLYNLFSTLFTDLVYSEMENLLKHEARTLELLEFTHDNLYRALWLALHDRQWDSVYWISAAHIMYLSIKDQAEEQELLSTQLLNEIGRDRPADAHWACLELWLLLQRMEAERLLLHGSLDQSEHHINRFLESLALKHDDRAYDRAYAYNLLGRINTARGKLDTAKNFFEKELGISEKNGFYDDAAITCVMLASIEEIRGDTEKASELARRAEKITSEHQENTEGSIFSFYQTTLKSGAAAYDEPTFRQDVNRFYLRRSKYGLVLAFITRAEQLEQMDNWDEAKELYALALTICESHGFDPELRRLYQKMGWIALLNADLELAEEMGLRAVRLIESTKNVHHLYSAYSLLGQISFRKNDYELAEEQLVRSLEYFSLLRTSWEPVIEYLILGRIAWTKKEFEKGERFLRAAIDKASRVYPDNPGLSEDGVKAHAWFDLGLAAAENGNLTDAWVRFLEALPHIYADKNYALAVACHENLGGIAERNGWVCAAIDHYQHELSACDELGDSSLTVQSLIRLAGLAYRLGDYCSTIRYLIRVTRESRDRSDRREAWSVMGDILEKLGEREFTRLWRAAVGENRLPEVLVRRVRKNRRFTSVARSRIADILSRIYGYIRNLLLRRGKNTAE